MKKIYEKVNVFVLSFEEEDKNYKKLSKQYQEEQKTEKLGKDRYVIQEQESIRMKNEYEEALRNQRRAAIGIAASMLEEGVPCPVCGSIEHPTPAPMEKGILTEEELETLKADYAALQEKIVPLENFKDKNILILGFGREGRSSYNFIRKYYKDKLITISDMNKDLVNDEVIYILPNNIGKPIKMIVEPELIDINESGVRVDDTIEFAVRFSFGLKVVTGRAMGVIALA